MNHYDKFSFTKIRKRRRDDFTPTNLQKLGIRKPFQTLNFLSLLFQIIYHFVSFIKSLEFIVHFIGMDPKILSQFYTSFERAILQK